MCRDPLRVRFVGRQNARGTRVQIAAQAGREPIENRGADQRVHDLGGSRVGGEIGGDQQVQRGTRAIVVKLGDRRQLACLGSVLERRERPSDGGRVRAELGEPSMGAAYQVIGDECRNLAGRGGGHHQAAQAHRVT